METILTLLQTGIFLLIAIVHFYWALGGKWGFDQALPTNEQGIKLLEPKALECVVVGFGLFLFIAYYLLKANFIEIALPQWLMDYSGWIISAIFLIRAIGDFKYVGFFKRLKNSDFGKMDSKFYSPLCLLIGSIGVALEFFY
ncbi:MAG: DUF3995 domain-containing protein [Chitinophagales bacterium]